MPELLRFNHSPSQWKTLTECNQLIVEWINGLMEDGRNKMLIRTHYLNTFFKL